MTHYNSFGVESDDGWIPYSVWHWPWSFHKHSCIRFILRLSGTEENVQVFIDNICQNFDLNSGITEWFYHKTMGFQDKVIFSWDLMYNRIWYIGKVSRQFPTWGNLYPWCFSHFNFLYPTLVSIHRWLYFRMAKLYSLHPINTL